MPKFKIVCFILAAVLAAVGTVLVLRNLGNDFVPPDKVLTEDDPNTYLDVTEDMDISDRTRDVREFLFAAHKLLLQKPGFKGVSRGKSTAMGGIEQNVLNTRVVLGEFGNKRTFKEMVTRGIVSNAYQLYLVGLGENGNYIYRGFDRVRDLDDVQWSSTAQALSRQAFYNKFGHRSDKLTSYILNWDTVLSGEFVSEQDGQYTFRYVLDTETSPADLRYEMITNGGLDGFPTFTKCEIYVTMDAGFHISSLRTDCAYQATTMGINAACTEDITEVFEDYEGELPYSDFFGDYLGTVGGDMDTEPTPLEMLMQMFGPYLNGTDLQARLAVTSGEQSAEALLSLSGLDISDFTKLAVDLRLGELNARYDHGAGKIFINYEDFNASVALDNITKLAGTLALFAQPQQAQTADSSAPEDFDVGSLLENLTYFVSDDESTCTVSLPLTLGELTVDARLVGVRDGDSYQFDYADIAIGDVSLHITRQSWTPTAISEDAPELLGLAELLETGKLSLHADVTAPLFGVDYNVNADVLADLESMAVSARATLNENGEIELCYADNVVYVKFGSLRFKLDVDRTDSLRQLFDRLVDEQLITVGEAVSASVSPEQLLGVFGGFKAVSTATGTALVLDMGDMQVALNLASRANGWNIDSVSVVGNGMDLSLLPESYSGEVTAPSDADSYADVTDMADALGNPVIDLIEATSLGADFDIAMTLGGKQYGALGSLALDEQGRLHVAVTLYDGDVGIIDADVTVADGTVYLTLDGVNTAFTLSNDAPIDLESLLRELSSNEQLKQLLQDHEDLKQLAETIGGAVQAAREFDPHELLTVDFTRFVTLFRFENGRLDVGVDGSPLGLDANVTIGVSATNGRLELELGGELGGVSVTASVKTDTDVTVTVPDAEDYILTLHGEALGAELDITADIVHMDIWASAHLHNEEILLRLVGGKLYVVYGGVKVVVDPSDLDGVMAKVKELVGDEPLPEAVDVAAVFAALGFGLIGEQPNLSLDYGGLSAAVNFANVGGKLVFDSITVAFDLNGERCDGRLTLGTQQAVKADISGEFADGNALADKLLDTFARYKDVEHIAFTAGLNVNVGAEQYFADVTINCNQGLYAKLLLSDRAENKLLVSAELYLVENTLYLDVNGIRQAVALPASTSTTMSGVLGALGQFKGTNDVLDSVLEVIERLPDSLDGITFSKVAKGLRFDGETLALDLALDQFELADVTVEIGLGDTLSIDIDGLALGKISLDGVVTAASSAQAVACPDASDYTTSLSIALGNGMSARAEFSAYEQWAEGVLDLSDKDSVLFRYEQGVAYLQYGNLSAKLAVKDISRLMGAIGGIVSLPELPQTEGSDAIDTVKKLLGMLGYKRTATDDGYTMEIDVDGTLVQVCFVCADSVTLHSIHIATDSELVSDVTVTLGCDSFDKVDMTREFTDITDVADLFAGPIAELLGADGYGIGFELELELDGKPLRIEGSASLNNGIALAATVYENDIGIVDIDVKVVGGDVFLTVNGIKAAFKLDNTAATDADLASAMEELLSNEQIKALLDEHESVARLVDKIKNVIGAITQLDIAQLDLAELLGAMHFDGKTLSLQLNASALELGELTLELSVDDGHLCVGVKALTFDSVTVKALTATVRADSDKITAPSVADYVLNLHLKGFGAEADISADLYNMNITAAVHYVNNGVNGLPIDETAYLRFVHNKLYIKLNNISLVFDAENAAGLIQKIMDLVGDGASVDINAMLAGLTFDLAGSHSVTYVGGGADVSVNFANEGGKLSFEGVTARFGKEQLTLSLQSKSAYELDTSGKFVDCNKLADRIFSLVERFSDAKGVEAHIPASVSVKGNSYRAEIALYCYNGNVRFGLELYDGKTLLVNAELWLVGSEQNKELYISVNGVKQHVALPDMSSSAGVEPQSVLALLNEFYGASDLLDGVIDALKAMPDKLASIGTVSDLVSAFTYEGDLRLVLNGSALGLGDITLTLAADDSLTVEGLSLAGISLGVTNATVQRYDSDITAPEGDFTAELKVAVGDIAATVRADAFNGTVRGVAYIYNNTIDLLFQHGEEQNILYLDCGSIGMYLDLADIDVLLEQLKPFVTLPEMGGSARDIAQQVLGVLALVSRESTADGYRLQAEIDGLAVTIDFDKQAALKAIRVSKGELTIYVTPSTHSADLTEMDTDAQRVNVTELATLFVPAVNDMLKVIKGESFHSHFELGVTLREAYTLSGDLDRDAQGNLHVAAKVLDVNGTCLIDADVIVTGNTVYLTINGVKVAFNKPNVNAGQGNTDAAAAIKSLLDNEQIKALLNAHEDFAQLVEQLETAVGAITQLDITKLNLAEIVKSFGFEDGKLTIKADCSFAKLGMADITLSVPDNALKAEMTYHGSASIRLNSAELSVKAQQITEIKVNNADDYVLKLKVKGFGADIDVVADLCAMDVRAKIDYKHEPIEGIAINETVLLRYYGGKLYLQAGAKDQIKLVFDKGVKEAIGTLMALFTDADAQSALDINALLAKLTLALGDDEPYIGFTDEGVAARITFTRDKGKPAFDGVELTLGGNKVTAQLQSCSVDGLADDPKLYENGNDLLSTLADILNTLNVKALAQGDGGIQTSFNTLLTLKGNSYYLHADLMYNNNLQVSFTLRDKDTLLVAGNVSLINNNGSMVLYLDINNIKQAVDLGNKQSDGDEQFHLSDLEHALDSYSGINDVLDAVIKFISKLPGKLNGLTTISDVIRSLTVGDNIEIVLAGTDLGLARDVTITLGMADGKVTYSVDELALSDDGKAMASLKLYNATLISFDESIEAPADVSTYVAELTLDLKLGNNDAAPMAIGADFDPELAAVVRLDLYKHRIFGRLELNSNKVVFELDTQSMIVYAELGASKVQFNLKTDINELSGKLSELLDSLARANVSLPDLGSMGSGKSLLTSLLNSLRVENANGGYELKLDVAGIAVGAAFNVTDDEDSKAVSLGKLTLEGGEFTATATQNKQLDATNKGLENVTPNDYFNLKDVAAEFIPAICALVNAQAQGQGYELNFGKESDDYILLTLGNSVYKLRGKIVLAQGNVYVEIESLTYKQEGAGSESYIIGENEKGDGESTSNKAFLWIIGDTLSFRMGDLSLQTRIGASSGGSSGSVTDSLKGIGGYNSYLQELLDLVDKIAATDLSTLDIAELLGISYKDGELDLNVDGSSWNVNSFNVTLAASKNGNNADGLIASLDEMTFGNIKLEISNLRVTATTTQVQLSDTYWATDIDISVDDDSGITNTIHVSLDLMNMAVYAMVTSQQMDVDTEPFYLYIKYDIANGMLWISNHGGVNVSVDVNDIGEIVAEVQNVVNKVAKEQHDLALPQLFKGDISLSTPQFFHDAAKGGIGVSFEAFGFAISANLAKGKLTADINVGSIFQGTSLNIVEGIEGAHKSFVEDINKRIEGKTETIVKYVSIDQVFDDLFYGPNGKLDDSNENNGVMYDLIETNAWRFDFNPDGKENTSTTIDITSQNEQGVTVTDSYRIKDGSYIAFAFNKSDTDFSMNKLISEFGNEDKTDAYTHLFELLNSLQLRAKLTLLKKANGEDNYNEMIILDVALLRTQETVYEGSKLTVKPKSRLYISYDSSSSRDGVLRATLDLDSLQDVIGLKDALDSVLNNAITKVIGKITEAIAKAQSSMPKLQLGRLARLFTNVSYGGEGKNFLLELNGKALSDELGTIKLDVSAYDGIPNATGADKRGRGLQVNQLQFSYGGVSVDLKDMIVSASTYTKPEGEDIAQNRTYDYVTYAINGYLNDNKASDNASGALSTPESFNKSNVAPLGSTTGYDMSNHMEFDSIRELLVGLIITASDRTFALDGTIEMDAKIIGLRLADYKMKIKLLVDIEGTDSYWALLLDRPGNMGLARGAFGDSGGKSYLLFDSRNGGTFSVVRHSEGLFSSNYSSENMTTEAFMADIMNQIMEMFNFSSLIRNLMDSKLELKEFGIEDILNAGDSYQYVKSDKRFDIKAELKAINNMFDTATLNIYHEGNMDDVGYTTDEFGDRYFNTAGVRLSNLKINTTIVSALTLDLNLNLLKENNPGLAKEYVTGHNYSWS